MAFLRHRVEDAAESAAAGAPVPHPAARRGSAAILPAAADATPEVADGPHRCHRRCDYPRRGTQWGRLRSDFAHGSRHGREHRHHGGHELLDLDDRERGDRPGRRRLHHDVDPQLPRRRIRPALVHGPRRLARNAGIRPLFKQVVGAPGAVPREMNAPIWGDGAEPLDRTRKNGWEVNPPRLSRYAAKGEQIVVPGVVLATGEIKTPVTVAAFRTSAAARKKIEAAGGRAITLLELAVQNPKGSGVRIMG